MTGTSRRDRLRASVEGLGRRGALLERRLLATPGIGTAIRAFGRYNEAGGGLVSRGLAFAILFAIVPAILLISSLAALLIGDPASRERILATLIERFPPLAPILGETLNSAVTVAPTTSLVSLVILLWSASGMVRSLDVAIGLVFREQAIPRSPLRLVGLVLAVGGAVLFVTGLTVLATLSGPLADLVDLGLSTQVAAPCALAVVILLAYRLLPRARPPLRVAIVPALAAACVLTALSAGFAFLSPLLIGSVQVFGALAVVFLGIVWLGFSTDVFLIGAAWTAVRAEDAAAAIAVRAVALAAARASAAAQASGTLANGDRPGI